MAPISATWQVLGADYEISQSQRTTNIETM